MSTGATTSCDFISSLFWNGSAHGVIRANGSGEAALDGFALNIPGCADTLNGGFERRLACWTSLTNEPEEMDWLLSINTHTGYYSVEAFSLFSSTYLQATLTSDLLAVTGGMDYCFSLYGKDTGDTETAHLEVIVRWYDHTQSLLRADLLLNLFSDALSSNWQIFTSFTDAPGEAVQASILLAFSTLTLTTEQDFSHSLFLDDLSFALCASTH
ncbi:MAG: hypothetical protein KJ063_25290 [Anaerolineae bacterium]|nr:hypothetical protein [Anaerolineae bacterium]